MLTLNLNYVKIINPYYKNINNLVGTEAQLVNEEIDARVVEFQDFWDLDTAEAGDPVDVRDEILKEIMSERKDRLGLHRTINTDTTVWSQRFNIDRSEIVSENLAEEPPYPFGPADPIFAFYANDKRDVITFFLRHPDNSVDQHTIDKSREHHPAWHHINKVFTGDDLERNTRAEINKINRIKEEQEKIEKEEKDKEMQERLFQMKVDAFELPIVNDSANRELKGMIRKAKSEMELFGAIGALYALNYMDEGKSESAAAE